ncbi:restriction endonuclease subunit S [Acinetobacter variabilis]|uniref:restriction endonuclease subunit S n=1 Tax=Acinetobacter variabilis TaxID=70346 RepID=UPI002897F3F5|nr:restriction endonuclease subunit S [Acinetobacter variabilis]
MAKYQAYAEYKDSGVEWLGGIPSHWDYFDGKRIFSSVRKQALSSDEQLAASQKYGVIPQNLMMQLNDSKVMLALKGTESFRHVEKNNFVISLRSFEGGIEHSNYEGCVSPAYTVLSSKKNIDYRYFKYLFKSAPFIAALQSTTDSLRDGKSISYEQFGNITLPLFSKVEQNTIANFLDHETAKIDHLIEKQQKLIELLKEKRQAVISHAVTKGLNPNVPMKDSGVEWLGEVPEHWDIVKLSQIAVAFNGDRGANYPSGNDFVDEGIYFISANEVINAKVVTETASRITQKKYDELGGLKIKKGDIIYCLRGAGVGKNGICDFDEGTVSSSLMGIRSIKLDPDYLVLLLNSSAELQQRSVLVNGSVSPNLSAENVMGYKFSIPAVDEQIEIKKSIELRVNKIEILLSNAEQAIQLMRERRTALISATVTGKIDVRNWQTPNVTEAHTELSA